MVLDPILFAKKVGQPLTECMDYRHIKKIISLIDCNIRSHCHEKVEMDQSLPAYTFIHFFVPKSEVMKT